MPGSPVYKADTVKVKDVIALAVVMAVMGPCKMVYGAIAGFCLLIPVKKSGNWGKWTVSAAAVLGSFLAAMAVVNLRTVAMYTQKTAICCLGRLNGIFLCRIAPPAGPCNAAVL